MNKLMIAACAAGVSIVSAFATDGSFRSGSTWSDAYAWLKEAIPGDGGMAYFESNAPTAMDVDQDVTLAGVVDTYNTATTWNGTGTVTLSRAVSTFLIESKTLTINAAVSGTGENTILKSGGGSIRLASPVSNAAAFGLTGGLVYLTDSAETQLHASDLRLYEGMLHNNTAGNALLPATTYGVGRSHVQPAGSSITFDSLTRANGTMTIIPQNGLSALGDTEKVFVTTPPSVVNGMVDASITVFDYTRQQTGYYYGNFFATYDAAKGFQPVTDGVAFDAAEDQSDKIVRLRGPVMMENNVHVHALYIDSTNGTLTLNKTLTVGDGSSAGILVNDMTGGSFTLNVNDGGAGELAFGTAPGVVWVPSYGHDNMTVNFNVPITGTKGVTFAAAPGYRSGHSYPRTVFITLSKTAAWTGPTIISGPRVILTNTNQLPEGDIYITGYNACGMGSLRHTSTLTFNENYTFHFSGSGYQDKYSPGGGAIHLGGSSGVSTIINGAVELRDTTSFAHDGENYVVFNGPVSGEGGLYLRQGYLVLGNAANTFSGDIEINSAAALILRGAGTLGTGRVFGANVKFENCADLTVTNKITCSGTATFDGGHVILNGQQTFTKTVLKNGAVVEVGPEVNLGAISASGASVVKPLAGNTKTADLIGSNKDYTINSGMRYDASAKLVKSGTNTVSVTYGVINGGSLMIYGGGVRLDNTYMNLEMCTYWMDASNASTVTTNAAGGVTKWVSANGNGATFYNRGTAPVYTNAPNGLGAMGMKLDNSNYNRFYSSGSLRQRTVFICTKPELPTPSTGTFGGMMSLWGGEDRGEYGIRYQNWDGGYARMGISMTAQRLNGKSGWSFNLSAGKPQVLTAVCTSTENFVTALGGYETWGADKMFNGLYYEAIAFDEKLDDTTIQQIENYLAVKWGINETGFNPDVGIKPLMGTNVLAVTTAVKLAASATLDLNGTDQTIASLEGVGKIINSSSTPAKLTVTGACDFSGTIGAGVTLVKTGDDEATVSGTVAGALAAEKGNLTVKKFLDAPPTDGLIFWMDAATASASFSDTGKANSMVTNSVGQVLKWYSREGSLSYFTNWGSQPSYTASGFRGVLPAIVYNGNRSIRTGSTISPRTIALVWWIDYSKIADIYANYILGTTANKDQGWRLNKYKQLEMYANCDNGFCSTGDNFYLNGVKTSPGTRSCAPSDGMTVAIGTRGDWHTRGMKNIYLVLGNYCTWNDNSQFYLGEALAWDRELTQEEIFQVNNYLRTKWAGSTVPTSTGSLADGTLTVKGGASVDYSETESVPKLTLETDAEGGTIVGDCTVNGFTCAVNNETSVEPLTIDGAVTVAADAEALVTDCKKLPRQDWTLLSVNEATGDFAAKSTSGNRFVLMKIGNAWVLKPMAFIIMFN